MNAQQMIAARRPIRDADNGTACTNCMRSDRRLNRCANCRRVKYCGKACQTQNWKTHKPICKILQSFHKMAVRTPDDESLRRGGSGKKVSIDDKFLNFRRLVPDDLPPNLSEESWVAAKNLVLRAPVCSVCYKSDYDFGGGESEEWKCCPRCHNGWCCPNHFEEYQATRHTTEICDKYIRATNIDRFRYNHIAKFGDCFLLVPERPLLAPFESFPRNWDEYFRLRMPEEWVVKRQLPEEYFPSGTYLLSQVTTCLYGMYEQDRAFFVTAKELTIHIVGAAARFELEGGSPTHIWEEILHCLPSVQRLNLVFVGPEVNVAMSLSDVACCPDCTAKGRKRAMAFHGLTYHDYRASDDFIAPDFVVAFNTGMFEEYTDSWKESLGVILSLGVPSIFTSYNKHEGDEDFKVLTEVNARTLTDAPVYNPFRVKIPLVDDGCIDKFFQANMYCTCFRGHRS